MAAVNWTLTLKEDEERSEGKADRMDDGRAQPHEQRGGVARQVTVYTPRSIMCS